MNKSEREDLIFKVAVSMAPAFRDKFDFSNQGSSAFTSLNNYEELATMAYLAAEALVVKHEARLIAAQAQDEKTAKAAATA